MFRAWLSLHYSSVSKAVSNAIVPTMAWGHDTLGNTFFTSPDVACEQAMMFYNYGVTSDSQSRLGTTLSRHLE